VGVGEGKIKCVIVCRRWKGVGDGNVCLGEGQDGGDGNVPLGLVGMGEKGSCVCKDGHWPDGEI